MNIPKRPVYRINKQVILALVFGLLLAASCQEAPVNDHISLVFQSQKIGEHRHISYLDDFMIPHVQYIQPGFHLRLANTSRTYVDVRYEEMDKTTRNYLFQSGDSVLFDITEKWPKVKVINRESGTVNFENDMYAYFYHDKPTPVEDFYYYWNMMNNPVGKIAGIDMSGELNDLKKRALKYLEMERSYIDSVQQAGVLDKVEARFYLMKNEIVKDRLAMYAGDSIDFTDNKVVAAAFHMEQEVDSLLRPEFFTFYNDVVSLYYDDYLSYQMPSYSSDVSLIRDLEFVPKDVRKNLVNKHIDYQLKLKTPGEGMTLVKDLKDKMVHFEEWNGYLTEKYHLDQQFDRRWRLQDVDREYLVFDDLLRRHQGRLIYVDFWASWCAPCIKEMPNSEKLSKEFTDHVSFVYLSLDKDFDAWRNSSKRFLDHHPEENYFLDSMNSKRVAAEFDVVSIPRYMLFNQEGKLVLQDAPRPGSEEIRSIFTRLIEEDI